MTQNLQLNKEEFVQTYQHYKKEGKSDKEICELLYLAKNTLYRYKKRCGIPCIPFHQVKVHYNSTGLTLELLEKAEKIGLDSHVINQRIRDYGWSLKDAVSIPKQSRRKRKKMKDG